MIKHSFSQSEYAPPAVEVLTIDIEMGFAQSQNYGNAGEAGTAFGADEDYGTF